MMDWERAGVVLEAADRNGSNTRGITAYLTALAAAAVQAQTLDTAVNTVAVASGAKKIWTRLQSTSNLDSVSFMIVYWAQNEAATGVTLGQKKFTLTVDPDVTNTGGTVFCSEPFELPALGENYEIRRISVPVGNLSLFAWEE